MANRHLARSVVLQTLFEWDFNGKPTGAADRLERNIIEFAPGLKEHAFTKGLFSMVEKKCPLIDEIIEKAAPDWPMDKIAIVDRNVLRIGLAELLFGNKDEVPPKVAINEAIELAKTFGGEKSGKFVNGVLGAVYKELGEPGKDDVAKKKHHTEEDLSKLPVEQKGGAVIFARDEEGDLQFAMVHDVFGYWTLSKGGIEKGESPEEGTIREVKEEIGLDVKILKKLGENEYVAHHPQDGKILKHVHYFLAEADAYKPLVLEQGTGGLDNAKWFKLGELDNIRTYDDILPLLARSIDYITTQAS